MYLLLIYAFQKTTKRKKAAEADESETDGSPIKKKKAIKKRGRHSHNSFVSVFIKISSTISHSRHFYKLLCFYYSQCSQFIAELLILNPSSKYCQGLPTCLPILICQIHQTFVANKYFYVCIQKTMGLWTSHTLRELPCSF